MQRNRRSRDTAQLILKMFVQGHSRSPTAIPVGSLEAHIPFPV